MLNHTGSLFSPGDELTLSYIWGRSVSPATWELKCAQALIYSIIVRKEETFNTDETFPHTRNDIESIAVVKKLSIDACRILFQRIRTLPSEEAALLVKNYLKKTIAQA